MRRFTDQFVAAFVAILINAAVFWFLASGVQHSLPATDTDESTAIQVVWLARPPAAKSPPRVIVTKRSATGAQKSILRQRTQKVTVVDLSPAATSTSALDVIGDDQWTPNALGAATESPATSSSFLRDPLKRRPERMEATQDRMHLTFTDRSLGGMLKRMTQRGNCLDLRRALVSDPTSSEVTLATMRKYGCAH